VCQAAIFKTRVSKRSRYIRSRDGIWRHSVWLAGVGSKVSLPALRHGDVQESILCLSTIVYRRETALKLPVSRRFEFAMRNFLPELQSILFDECRICRLKIQVCEEYSVTWQFLQLLQRIMSSYVLHYWSLDLDAGTSIWKGLSV
jgi:hypothetical protein